MRQPHLTRRRFMNICASAGVLSALPLASAVASAPLHHWNGILLGAHVSLTLAHPSKTEAERIFALSVKEIKRLENIFTLYDSQSELARLNAQGNLDKPSAEMLDILRAAATFSDMTDGAFDVTVKTLEDGQTDTTLIGMGNIEVENNRIRLLKSGMGITLNGIAQGFITDRITALLKAEGLTNVLVELGEKHAIGGHPSGRPWFISADGHNEPIALTDQALATSAAISPNTGNAHIFDPKTGKAAQSHSTISVRANTATMADALSTAFMSMSLEQIKHVQSAHQDIYQIYRT